MPEDTEAHVNAGRLWHHLFVESPYLCARAEFCIIIVIIINCDVHLRVVVLVVVVVVVVVVVTASRWQEQCGVDDERLEGTVYDLYT